MAGNPAAKYGEKSSCSGTIPCLSEACVDLSIILVGLRYPVKDNKSLNHATWKM